MNTLKRYGIKDVADVVFYELNGTKPGKPVLFLDSLKVSTTELTSENTTAKGGKGNVSLIGWDSQKDVTLTLEDALISEKNLALSLGGEAVPSPEKIQKVCMIAWNQNSPFLTYSEQKGKWCLSQNLMDCADFQKKIIKTEDGIYQVILNNAISEQGSASLLINGRLMKITEGAEYTGEELKKFFPSEETMAEDIYLPKGLYLLQTSIWSNKVSTTYSLQISAETFPGIYYVTGDTIVRNEKTGKDEMFQLIIPKAKILSENNTITMEAEGDPTVISLSVKALKPKNGPLMSLIQYKPYSANEQLFAWMYLDEQEEAEQEAEEQQSYSMRREASPAKPFRAHLNVSRVYGNVSNVITGKVTEALNKEPCFGFGAAFCNAGDYQEPVTRDYFTASNSYENALYNEKAWKEFVKQQNPEPGEPEEQVHTAAIVFDNNLFLHFLYLDEVKIEQDDNIFSGKFYLDDSEKNVAIIIKITQEKKFILDIEINYDWLFSEQGLAWVATMGLRIAMGHYVQWSGNVAEGVGRELLAIGVNLMFSQMGVPVNSFMQELKDAGVIDLEDVMESLSL